MNPAPAIGFLLVMAGGIPTPPRQVDAPLNPQQQFAEAVFQSLGHPDPTALHAAIASAPYRALPLVHDLLYQASSPRADPGVLKAARRIAHLLEMDFNAPAAREAVERFDGFDERDRRRRVEFESLLPEASAAVQKGRFKEALEKGRRAFEISRELGIPYLQARALRLLGEIEGGRDRIEQARGHFLKALGMDESLSLEVQLLWDCTLLGDLDFRQGRYASSLEWYGKALEKAESCHESGSKAILLSNRGALYSFLGRYEEAEESLSLAIETARRIGDRTREAYALSVQGGLESGRGNYEEAVKLLHASSAAWKAAGDFIGEGRTLVNLAGVLSELGQSADAEDTVKSALDLFPKEKHPVERGRALTMQGLIALDAGHPARALEYLELALDALEESGDAAGTAEALQHKATALLRQGKAEEAERFFTEAFNHRSDLGDLFGSVLSLTGLGDALRAQGRRNRAEQIYLRALERADPLKLPELLWRAQYGLGVMAEAEGRIQEATDFYASAIQEVEKIRTYLTAPTLRQRYLGDKLSLYRRIARLFAKQGRLAEAFRMAEAAKARTLLEVAAGRPAGEPMHSGLSGEAFKRLQEAESRLRLLELRLGELGRREETRDLRAVLEQRLQEARADHKTARLRLELAAPRIAELSGLAESPSIAAVQEAIPDDAALLEYLVGPEGASVMVVEHDRSRFVELNASEKQISEWVHRILHPIERLRNGEIDLANMHFDVKAASALYQALILPLRDDSRPFRQLWIVPDGSLRKLPFALLVTGHEKRPVDHRLLFAQYEGCRFLIEDMALGYLPAAGLLVHQGLSNSEDSQVPRALVLADPHPLPDGALPLPAAREEAAAVARHFGSGRVELLLGPQATEARCKSPAPRVSFLHLACHAGLNDRRPAYSRLALASSRDEDGWLHAYEIERIPLYAEHVILSACETVGTAGRGEGLLGLSRAFLQAGARSVLATAWVVDDRAAACLMDRFYGAVESGESPIQALHTAQIATLREGRRPGLLLIHPFFWAGFLHVGNP